MIVYPLEHTINYETDEIHFTDKEPLQFSFPDSYIYSMKWYSSSVLACLCCSTTSLTKSVQFLSVSASSISLQKSIDLSGSRSQSFGDFFFCTPLFSVSSRLIQTFHLCWRTAVNARHGDREPARYSMQ